MKITSYFKEFTMQNNKYAKAKDINPKISPSLRFKGVKIFSFLSSISKKNDKGNEDVKIINELNNRFKWNINMK